MKTNKFIKNKIHYIKETFDNGAINIYPDPKFQPKTQVPSKPRLPKLNTIDKKLDFIINNLRLKDKYK